MLAAIDMTEINAEKVWDMIVSEILRLKAEKGVTQEAIAKILGVTGATVSRWVNGKQGDKKTTFADMMRYVYALGIAAKELFPDVIEGDFDLVQKVEARLGAGGSLETSAEPIGLYAFRRDFLGSFGSAGNLRLFDVSGESMEPTIFHGDTVLVNLLSLEIRSGDLYAVRVGKELMIKRVFRKVDGLLVKSDNPLHPQIEVNSEEEDNFGIIGKVIWMARVFRNG